MLSVEILVVERKHSGPKIYDRLDSMVNGRIIAEFGSHDQFAPKLGLLRYSGRKCR